MRVRSTLLFALALTPFALPLIAHATGIPYFGPIVGLPNNVDGVQTCAAGWRALMQVVNNLIAFSITIGIVFIAPLLIAYAGFLYVVNPVSPDQRSHANAILLNTIVGIVIALAAWLIVNAVLTVLTVKDGAKGSVAAWTSSMFSTTGDPCLLKGDKLTKLNQAPLDTSAGATGEYGVGQGGSFSCPPGSEPAGVAGCAVPERDGLPGYYELPNGYSCSGGTFNRETGGCTDSSGEFVPATGPTGSLDTAGPTVTSGGRGSQQCADSNEYCSQQALLDQGLTSAQAAAMSCIAYSENAGLTVGYSGTGPCGVFQTSMQNNRAYTPSGCGAGDACINGTCSLGTAVSLFRSRGYQPWTGFNSKAAECQQRYDPDTTLRR